MIVKIGIIGGTGLGDPKIMSNREEKSVTTPFGPPSGNIITGKILETDCVVLPRHGEHHHLSPSRVNYRANIYALKQEGCTHVIVTNAAGSLKEDIAPGDVVVIDQFYDKTYKRHNSFYDGSSDLFKGVCHIPMDAPFCPVMRHLMIESLQELSYRYHPSGSIVVCEGPRFSSKAESAVHRQWGMDVVGMTTCPEVCLAKELGLLYVSAVLVTDYDCWREADEYVNVKDVEVVMKDNSIKAKALLMSLIPKIQSTDWGQEVKAANDLISISMCG